MNKRKIFIIVSAVILSVVLASGSAFFSINASRELYDYQDRQNRESSLRIASGLNSRLQAIEDIAEKNGRTLQNMPALSSETVKSMLERALKKAGEKRKGIYGMAVALQSDMLADHPAPVMFYARFSGNSVIIQTFELSDCRYTGFPWYCVPRYLGETIWSEPYFDAGVGNVLMTTCSMPFYRMADGRKVFAGVATADVTLTQLQRFLNSQQEHRFKYMFMVSKFGRLLSSPDISKAMTETVYSVAFEENASELAEQFRRDIGAGRPGMVQITRPIFGLRRGNLYYAPLAANEWSLVMGYDLKIQEQYARNITFLTVFVGLGLFGVLMTGVIIVSRRLPDKNNRNRGVKK